MKRKLLFTRTKKIGVYLLSCFFTLFSITMLTAQNSKVVPDVNVSGVFGGPYVNSGRIYQLIIDDSQLTSLAGKYLKSIEFRLQSGSWPSSDSNFFNYNIYLSNGVDPVNSQSNFTANVVGPKTLVKTGPLTIPANSVTSTFSYALTFNTPWLYNGTNLVIQIEHEGCDTPSALTHSASTATSGYGTLFSSYWGTSGSTTGTQGGFTYVKINAIDALGVESVEIGEELSVYPNPAKDLLNIKSVRDMVDFDIFNMSGQKIFSQKNNAKTSQLNVSSLPKGNYILQMTDKEGSLGSVKFIKE